MPTLVEQHNATLPARAEHFVDAHAVAASLGVVANTIPSLCRGQRGYQNIEPLPGHEFYFGIRRRVFFLPSEVKAWQERTGYKPMTRGRHVQVCPHCGKPVHQTREQVRKKRAKATSKG
jgi:hypothetical protein